MTGRQDPRSSTQRTDGCRNPGERERSKLHSPLGHEGQGDLLQGSTLDGSGAVRRHRERSTGQWRSTEER